MKEITGLDSLLPVQAANVVEIPVALLSRMEANGVWAADVITLIEMLLDGRLRRAA